MSEDCHEVIVGPGTDRWRVVFVSKVLGRECENVLHVMATCVEEAILKTYPEVRAVGGNVTKVEVMQ